MDNDELLPRAKPDGVLEQLRTQDLDRLSIAELEARISALTAEIERARAQIASGKAGRAAADALFR